MYEYISGTVAEATPAYAVIDAGGVGYYLHISLETFSAVEHAQKRPVYTCTTSCVKMPRSCTVSQRKSNANFSAI